MLNPSPEKQDPPWAKELDPLPIPYPPRTQLKGTEAVLFTKCVTGAYSKGGSIRDIAGRTGRAFGSVRTRLLSAGVKLRKRGGAHNNQSHPQQVKNKP